MKFVKTTLLAAIMLLVSAVTMAQSVDDIIAKHIEVRGGIEKIRAMQSLVADANMEVQGQEVLLKFYRVQDKLFKVEISVMGTVGYQMTLPTESWTYMPIQGQTEPQKLPNEILAAQLEQLDLQGPLVDYKEKGNKVELAGNETIEGSECSKIKLTNKNGTSSVYFIDNKTYYIVKISSKRLRNGAEVDFVTTFSDYKKDAAGNLFAYKSVTPNGPVVYEKFEVNAKIDEAVFKPTVN
jgi:hypothetical protein